MKEAEIDIDELEVCNSIINVRLIVSYRMDRYGDFAYSRIDSGNAYSDRRSAWVPMSRNLLDTIYDKHYQRIEEQVMDIEKDDAAIRREYMDMKRDFERVECDAIRRRYA